MKKFLCSGLFACFLLNASAQSFFVYIESVEPFFVKLNERTYSSGNAGYLILTELEAKQPGFRIGFPQNRFPDQLFNLPLDGNDHGFRLTNSANDGWGLFDLQTSRTVPAAKMVSAFRMEPRTVSAFTEILSRATDDPSLRFTMIRLQPETRDSITEALPTPAAEAKAAGIPGTSPAVTESPVRAQVDTIAGTVQADISPLDTTGRLWDGLGPRTGFTTPRDSAVAVRRTADPVPAEKTRDVITPAMPGYTRSVITKRSESSTTAGFGLTFIDEYDNGKDTIEILIPRSGNNIHLETGSASQAAVSSALPVNCRSVVTDAEFARSIRKMKATSKESAMLDEAGKLVRSRCISTDQVRSLAQLFPGDGGRLKLFELLFPKAADPSNFMKLESELKDDYFITRFRSLLRQTP